MNHLDVKKAREDYLAAHPLDMHEKALMTQDLAGNPNGFFTMPNLGDLEIVAMKLGAEYLAICHDEDLVTEWVGTVMTLAGETEMAAILFARIFRGMDALTAVSVGTADDEARRETFAQVAVTMWSKHLGGDQK